MADMADHLGFRILGLVFGISLALSGGATVANDKRQIRVFVALCDNATQGIQKVPQQIGDGDNPTTNLYWGCSDGLSAYFKKSGHWNLVKTETFANQNIIERLVFQHTTFTQVELIAEAYRGSAMKACLEDFLAAVTSPGPTEDPLVAFIGHNGLMEHTIANPAINHVSRDTIVLGCLTESYFNDRLKQLGSTPLLLTKSLMYPGSFLLHDAIEGWLRDETTDQIRERAARAYAKNQKISIQAARTIFADLSEN